MQSQFSSYIIIFFLFFFPLLRVAAYELVASDRISINCGSPAATSTALSGREWVGDDVPNPKFSIKGSSSSSRSVLKGDQTVAVDPVPYNTARVSRSQFTYTFRRLGSPGQKLIRLHFNPSSTESFNDYFTVEAGPFTLLANFSPSINARALSLTNLVKEFCLITTHENQPLNIIFTPFQQQQKHSYAFINGLEIISLPSTLSNCHGGDIGVRVVGQKSVVHIDHTTALETIQRLNFKWDYVPLSSDNIRGMFGMWPTILKQKAYNNNNNNITWKTSVDVGFRYLVRLHFSEMGIKMADNGHKDFVLLINHMIATTGADILREGDERHTSLWYKNYMVMVQGHKRESKHVFLISLCSKDEFFEENIPLEGFEIFKLSNLHNSLAGPNPLTPPTTTSRDSLSTNNILVSVLGFRNAIATIVVTIICLLNIIFHFLRQNWESQLSDEDLMPSNRAKQLCRHFSLFEIESATVNFNDAYVIGKGGFGKVYKGLIDNEQQIVAIKRLKSDSNQGMREFWTEIEILSELRHVNLVSLIGYCNNPPEMIIVYEYMPRGTLADHLYKLARKNNNNNNNNASSLLSWKQRLNICIGAGRGLDYLHTGHGIIHRDVKTSNILLDENSVAKVSDFGLAKTESGSELQSLKGSFGYFDPDYYSTRILTTKSDVYSFGVVLLEVLCGRPAVEPMADEDERSLNMWARDKINKGEVEQIVDPSLRGEISPNSLKAFVRVAERCLRDEPKKRPAMANVVIRLQFALKQQENAESLVPSDEITSVADFFPSNNGNANSSAPNASDDVVVTSAQQAEEKSVLSDEIITGVSNVLSRSDKTSLSVPLSSNVQNVTSTLKEQTYSGMINAGKRDGRKRVMHKLSRLLPWNAFSSIAKPSKKKFLFSVSAPMASRNTRNTSVLENNVLKANNTFAGKRVSESYELMPTPNLRVFSFKELKAATRNFNRDLALGGGGFGIVYKGWIDEKPKAKSGSGSAIAIKKLSSSSRQGWEEWQTEVNFLGRLSHPNLVKLLGYCREGKELLLVYEYLQKGSLENHLFPRGSDVETLPWDIRLQILIGAARGMAFLHSLKSQVIYRDFKTSNILLDESYNAKLSDFGLAKLGPTGDSSHVSTRVVGTYGYAAPEYMITGHLSAKSDVYGFGVVLVEMLTGLRSLDHKRPSEQRHLVGWIKPYLLEMNKLKTAIDSRLEGRYPTKSAATMARLARNCLESEPRNRPSMQEIVEVLERIDKPVESLMSQHPKVQFIN